MLPEAPRAAERGEWAAGARPRASRKSHPLPAAPWAAAAVSHSHPPLPIRCLETFWAPEEGGGREDTSEAAANFPCSGQLSSPQEHGQAGCAPCTPIFSAAPALAQPPGGGRAAATASPDPAQCACLLLTSAELHAGASQALPGVLRARFSWIPGCLRGTASPPGSRGASGARLLLPGPAPDPWPPAALAPQATLPVQVGVSSHPAPQLSPASAPAGLGGQGGTNLNPQLGNCPTVLEFHPGRIGDPPPRPPASSGGGRSQNAAVQV